MRCLLASMDGMTTAAFRSLCFEYGADGATTEMIGALSIAYARRKLSPVNRALMLRRPEEGFLAAQIIGSDTDAMAAAARRLEALDRFDMIEINMGCPARKVTGSGNGSALLKDPGYAEQVIRAVCEAVSLPVRLKMRLGWDREHLTAVQIARSAEALGCKEIIIHGRTRDQLYQGETDIFAMRDVCDSVSIPVYANGSVTSAKDARNFMEQTGAAGVCIGRAALKEPWIFQDIHLLEKGEKPVIRLLPERISCLITFAERLVEQKQEHFAICEMRKYVRWWLDGFSDTEDVFSQTNAAEDLNAFRAALLDYLNKKIAINDIYPGETTRSLDTMMHPKRTVGGE